LVVSVVPNSPADKAGLHGGTRSFTPSNGPAIQVGGDVITGVDGQSVTTSQDLINIIRSGRVGQSVTLNLLRNGAAQNVSVILEARPATAAPAATEPPTAVPQATPQAGATGQATTQATGATPFLGVSVVNVTPDIAGAMNLNANQTGALIEIVAANSPADKAGLRGSSRAFTPSNGSAFNVGGDIITGVDGQTVATVQDLTNIIRSDRPGQQVALSLLRNGATQTVNVTLEARPAGQ
jgi:S1-C subfamily serine protease